MKTAARSKNNMPLLRGRRVALLAGRAPKKIFWTVFGMSMPLHDGGIHRFG